MSTGNEKSRGYHKIKSAASAFDFDFKNKVVLDIGSSTGGFTEYALEKGAKKVIAVEKGTHQMKLPLRNNPKVELHEKCDIFGVGIVPSEGFRSAAARGEAREPHGDGSERRDPMKESIPAPDIILADVSFISLTKILEYARINLARSDTDFLVMLKPQFEATEKELRNGIVKNDSLRRNIIKNFEHWLKINNFLIIKKIDNHLQGRHGNTERFYWLKQGKR